MFTGCCGTSSLLRHALLMSLAPTTMLSQHLSAFWLLPCIPALAGFGKTIAACFRSGSGAASRICRTGQQPTFFYKRVRSKHPSNKNSEDVRVCVSGQALS